MSNCLPVTNYSGLLLKGEGRIKSQWGIVNWICMKVSKGLGERL